MTRDGSGSHDRHEDTSFTIGGAFSVFMMGLVFLLVTTFLVYRELAHNEGTASFAWIFATIMTCAAHLLMSALLWKNKGQWNGTEQARWAYNFLAPCAVTSLLNLSGVFIFPHL